MWTLPPYGHDVKPGLEGSIEMVLCNREVITTLINLILYYGFDYSIICRNHITYYSVWYYYIVVRHYWGHNKVTFHEEV